MLYYSAAHCSGPTSSLPRLQLCAPHPTSMNSSTLLDSCMSYLSYSDTLKYTMISFFCYTHSPLYISTRLTMYGQGSNHLLHTLQVLHKFCHCHSLVQPLLFSCHPLDSYILAHYLSPLHYLPIKTIHCRLHHFWNSMLIYFKNYMNCTCLLKLSTKL